MYSVGDLIIKTNTGICEVVEISELDFQVNKGLYYTLAPVDDQKTKVYVPVDPDPESVRLVMTHDEAEELLNNIPNIEPIEVENEKQREYQYQQALKSNNPYRIAAIIKVLYQREQAKLAAGKKTTAVDKRYFIQAEKMLYSELAAALQISEKEVPGLIRAKAMEG